MISTKIIVESLSCTGCICIYLKGDLGWALSWRADLMFTAGGKDFLEQYKKKKRCFFPVKNISCI